jgi:hypothetical protein
VARSFGDTRGFAAGPAEGCETRGNSKTHCRHSQRMQEPGMPGDSSSAHLEERGFGDTRRFTARYAERMRDSRKLDDPSLAQPERCRTRGHPGTHHRRSWKSTSRGNPERQRQRRRGCEIRGNSMIDRRHGQRTEGSGKLEAWSPTRTKGAGLGQPGNAYPAQAERSRRRGNPPPDQEAEWDDA